MKKEDTIKTASSKKTWKTPVVSKIDVTKNTQGKPATFVSEVVNYAPS